MQNDLISRSERLRQIRQTEPADCGSAMLISDAKKMIRAFIEEAPAVKAVPVEVLGEWGKLLLPYKGDPRGPVGRMGDGHLEEEALHWGVVTDADGGRWVPVQEAVLLELIEKAKANDPESLRPKGRWKYDECNLEWACSECLCAAHVNLGAISGYILSDFCPNCGCKMEG